MRLLLTIATLAALLLFMSPSVSAGTAVGGTISVDTTWTLAGSPYVVTSSVAIQGTDGADGVTTLTIEPGVEVRAQSHVSIAVAPSSGSVGALHAKGTAAAPILFTTDGSPKSSGSWRGVSFHDGTRETQSAFENVTVEYAGGNGGVYVYRADVPLRSVRITDSATWGVYAYASASPLHNVTAMQNGYDGLFLSYHAGEIAQVTATQNGWNGLSVGGNAPVLDGLFAHNGRYGLSAWANAGPVLRNHFESNAQRPLSVSLDATFEDNTFQGNAIQQIHLYGLAITRDQAWQHIRDAATGEPLSRLVEQSFVVRGTDGADGVTTLTIEPGVEARFASNAHLSVGASSTPGALDARGTQTSPIVFTSNQPAGSKTPGAWGGIRFESAAQGNLSALENVTVEYGGTNLHVHINADPVDVRNAILRHASGNGLHVHGAPMHIEQTTISDNGAHGVYLQAADATLRGVALDRNGQYGLFTHSGLATLEDNTFHANAQRPARIDIGSRLDGNAFSGNAIQEIELIGATLVADRALALLRDAASGEPVTYVFTQNMTVQGTDGADGVTTLTLEPGVEARFRNGISLTVAAALDARGTSTSPIVFTSSQAIRSAGDWAGVMLLDSADDVLTRVENITLEYAGGSGSIRLTGSAATLRNVLVQQGLSHGVLVEGGSPMLHHLTSRDNAGHGIHVTSGGTPTVASSILEQNGLYGIHTAAGAPDVLDSTFRMNAQRPLRMNLDGAFAGNTFDGNAIQEIELFGHTLTRETILPRLLDATSKAPLSYLVTQSFRIDGVGQRAKLTLEPGVELRFAPSVSLSVGGTGAGALDARGTTSSPILFTSSQPAGSKTPGAWSGITFQDRTVDGESYLTNTTIEYAGPVALGINAAAPTVRSNHVHHSSGLGIGASSIDGLILRENRIEHVATGMRLAGWNVRVEGNVVNATFRAAHLWNLDGSLLQGNHFTSGDDRFYVSPASTDNRIANNAFVRLSGGSPVWDDGVNHWNVTPVAGTSILGGPTLGGNAYSDYSGLDLDDPFDGLGDHPAPYVMGGAGGAADHHPLVTLSSWMPDNTPPATSAQLDGLLHASGWYRSNVTLELMATDDVAVEAIFASVDGGPFVAVTGPFVVEADGLHEVAYYAVDVAGNVEETQSVEVPIDRTAPVVTVTAEAVADVCFEIAASDHASGLAALTFSVLHADGSPATNATGTTLLDVPIARGTQRCAELTAEGHYEVLARAADVAGHETTTSTGILALDLSPPELTVHSPEAGTIYRNGQAVGHSPRHEREGIALVVGWVNASASASDNVSGVARIEIYVDDVLVASVDDDTITFQVGSGLEPGRHVLRFRALDAAGHAAEETRTIEFRGRAKA